MKHQYSNAVPPQFFPPSPSLSSFLLYAGIQGQKENMSLPPRMPRQAGHDGDKGNALFLILIAVALFAALSYAITQSSRGGGGIEREKQIIDTAVSQQCTAIVESGIMRLRMVNGCDPSEISYELADGTNENPDAPADESCHLFRPNGAGVAACGAYLEAAVETGTITLGDTDTIALMAAGGYLKCESWTGMDMDVCVPQLSLDGENFFGGDSAACLYKNDGSARGFGDAIAFQPLLGSAICSAMCGGTLESSGAYVGGNGSFYIEDDYSLTPFTDACGYSLNNVRCSCW